MFYGRNPANSNHKKPRKPKEPTPEITAYPSNYWDDAPPYKYNKPTYTTAYLQRLGWCMECKENPCKCVEPGDEWIEPDELPG